MQHRWFQGRDGRRILEWDARSNTCVWLTHAGDVSALTSHDLKWAIQNRVELPYPPWHNPNLMLPEGL